MSRALPVPEPRPRLAVICFGFDALHVRRQPWHVAHGLACGFALAGREVVVLTDSLHPPPPHVPYATRQVPALFANGRLHPELRRALLSLGLERAFLVTGALRLARLESFDLPIPVSLVMTSPRLQAGELLRLGPVAAWRERRVLRGPLLDALLPGSVLRWGFERSGAMEPIYLSGTAQARYAALGLPPGRLLPPRVDPAAIPRGVPPEGRRRIVYLGPPLAMRGADLALTSFEQAVMRGLDAELLLLLRPDSGRASLARFLRRVRLSPVRGLIRCTTRMLAAAELRQRLAGCHVYLLPFRTPVSEVPLVVLEAGLSGRRLVVLEAPGVAEYAAALGGVVAPDEAALPQALIRACALPPAAVPDPTLWTRWDLAVAALPPPAPVEALRRYRFVGLIGVDGVGKSFLLRLLADEAEAAGLGPRHAWSRFRNYLSKPLLALTRLTGHNRKVHFGGVRMGYHEFTRPRALGLLFIAFQALDQMADILLRHRWPARRHLVLADRCVLDTLVDLAVDTGRDDLVIDRLGPWLVGLLPAPGLLVLVERNARLIHETRADALMDRNFARRRALYRRVARRFGVPVLRNEHTADEAFHEILRLARLGGVP